MTQDSALKTILITGGCGFIGTNLAEYLSGKGYRVRILDNLSSSSQVWTVNPPPTQQTAELIIGDIRDKDMVNQALKGVDAVVHLAAHTSVVGSLENPEENWDININGTLNLLEACRQNRVDKFIFASSNAAVGEQTPPIDERAIPRPLSPYGASKLAGEALCSAYYHSFGLKTISLRFANCYGPYSDHKSSVIARFMGWAREGKPLIIYGDGNQTRDFIHVVDVCQAIYLSLMTLDFYSEVFQIASGVETTINELAEMIEEVTGNKLQIIHQMERKAEIRRNYADVSKARAFLGFQPKVELREGLKRLCNQHDDVNFNR
jgi:UDP-glucose 4-epimerase